MGRGTKLLLVTGFVIASSGCAKQDLGGTPRCPERDPDREPGGCFEWAGPAGMTFSPPHRADLCLVNVGERTTFSVSYYNFCADTESLNVDTYFLEGDGYERSPAYFITSAPEPCTTLSMMYDSIGMLLRPGEAGFHRAAIRYEVTHGTYDFEFVAEAVEPGEPPARLDSDCSAFEDILRFGGVVVGDVESIPVVMQVTCSLDFGHEHLVILDAVIEGDESGAFELDPDVSEFCINMFISTEERHLSRVYFTPPAAGSLEAELVVTTNEPAGEHRISLVGTGLDW